MANPQITAELINELRQRVIAHNESVKAAGGETTRLEELKKLYKRNYRGDEPGVRAMGAVDAHLEKLAKAFESDEHPRGQGGRFSSKGGRRTRDVSIALAHTEQEHERLQDESPTYRALTTEVIPERRNELAGWTAREIGTFGAGVGLTAALASARPNSIATKAIGIPVGWAARHLAGGSVAAGAHGIASGLKWLGRRAASAYTHEDADRTAEAAARFGARYGRKAGELIARGAGRVVRIPPNLVARGAFKAGQPIRGHILHGTTIGLLGLAPGAYFNQAIAGTAVDPRVLGALADQESYRVVRKAVDCDEVDALRKDLSDLMRKGAGAGDLQKAMPGLYGKYGAGVLSALAGAAGGAAGRAVARRAAIAGAAAVAGGAAGSEIEEKGNPYRDKRGRFTSKENAVSHIGIAGGIVGGALAGAGALYAIKTHNRAAYRAWTGRLANTIDRWMARAQAGKITVGEHATMVRNRDDLIKKEVDKDNAHQARIEALENHAGSPELHYTKVVRDDINSKIAEIVGDQPKLKLPARVGKSHSSVMAAIEKMGPEEFGEAIKDLPKAVKAEAKSWFDRREAETANVGTVLKAHRDAVIAADIAHQKALVAMDAAGERLKKAVQNRNLATVKTKEKATQEFDEALRAHSEAKAAAEAANEAARTVRANPPEITSPVSGDTIALPTKDEVDRLKRNLTKDAYGRAEKRVDKKIAEAHGRLVDRVAENANRAMAAHALLGMKARVIPGGGFNVSNARRMASALVSRQNVLTQAEASLVKAKAEEATAKAALDRLKAVRAGRKVKDLDEKSIAEIKANEEKIKQDHEDASHNVLVAQTRVERARVRRNTAAQRYRDSMVEAAPPPANARGMHPLHGIMREVKRDLERSIRHITGPAKALLQRPSAQTLKAFIVDKSTKGYSHAERAFTDTWHDLFMNERKDGKGWAYSPVKVVTRSALLVPVVHFGHDAIDYARDRLKGNKKAKFPTQIQIDKRLDAYGGHGYTAFTVPDPQNPIERVVLWGQRYNDIDAKPEALYPGGSIKDVRKKFDETKAALSGGGGYDAPDLKGDDKAFIDKAIKKLLHDRKLRDAIPADDGGSVVLRDPSAHDANEAAKKLLSHIRNQVTAKKTRNAMAGLFSNQGRVLTNRQVYTALTGYQHDGNWSGPGIFPKDPRFASSDSDTVGEALSDAISKSRGELKEQKDRVRMHRAVAAIGDAKGLPEESIGGLHALVKARPDTDSEAEAEAAPVSKAHPTERVSQSYEMPKDWSRSDVRHNAATVVAEYPDGFRGQDRVSATDTVEALMKSVPHMAAHAKLDPDQAATIVQRTLSTHFEADPEHASEAAEALISGDVNFFTESLIGETSYYVENLDYDMHRGADEVLHAYERPIGEALEKGILLDDFDALVKAFPLAKVANPKLLGNAIEEGVDAVQIAHRNQEATPKNQQRAWYNPARIANEIGTNLASDGAFVIAQKIAQRFIPGGAAVAGALEAAPQIEQASKVGAKSWPDALRAAIGNQARNIKNLPGQTVSAVKDFIKPRNSVPLAAGSLASFGAGTAARRAFGPSGAPPSGGLGQTAGSALGGLYLDNKIGAYGTNLALQLAGKAVGRVVGEGAGDALGAIAGPVGMVVGGAVGTWAGSKIGGALGSYADKYFSGYDQDTIQRATQRYTGGAAAGRRMPSAQGVPAGRMPASGARTPSFGMGGHGGDPYHDQLGRFATASGGTTR